jgi:tetratricopeptide (TPR) repeat protein
MSRRKKTRSTIPQAFWEKNRTLALRLRAPAGIALLILVVVLAYSPSMSGGFVWDDDKLLTDNGLVQAPDGPYRFFATNESLDYWPASNATFWLEWRLWRLRPAGYHVSNLILHICESLLVWIILRKLSIPGAFLAALIFAVHPVNVESAAWIASRKNLVAMLFFLLSILWYFKTHPPIASVGVAFGDSLHGRAKLGRHPSSLIPYPSSLNAWYWLSLGAFVLAMLGKGSAAVLPIVLLAILWWRRLVTWRGLLRTAPFFVIAAALSGVNVWFQTHGTDIVYRSAGLCERMLGAAAVIWFYLYKALFPLDLAFVYRPWHIDVYSIFWWTPLALAIAVTGALWWFRRAWSRPLLLAWICFCAALVPVMGFTDIGFMEFSLVADRYQHIAIIAVVALAAAPWSVWHAGIRPQARRWATVAALGAVGALAFLAWQQNGIYRNAVTLYEAALKKNPRFWMGHYNLGIALTDADRAPDAIRHYLQAIEIKPDYFEAYNNLGLVLGQNGRPREAVALYRQALRINPDYAEAHNNLGKALLDDGQLPEAIEHLRRATVQKPRFAEPYGNLGVAMLKSGRLEEAIEYYRRALTLKPSYPEIQYNMGNALLRANRPQEAIGHYLQALRLKPDYFEAHNNLGSALIQVNRPRDAVAHIDAALRLKPDYINAYTNLALAYASLNQPSQAIAAGQQALALARAQGQTALAWQIEDWLSAYRAGR